MIPVVTVAQMRLIDEVATGKDLTTGYSYMLKAGTGLYEAARAMLPESTAGEIAVVCGKGNNGGDGYVAARLLLEAGYRVMCFSLCGPDELKGEARRAFNEYTGQKGNVLIIDDAGDLSNLAQCRLIIDAVLGTGARGAPHGLFAMAIKAINEARVPVIAADTPSGLDSDTGTPGVPCVKAAVTVTMGFPKIGQYFYPGRDHVGKLAVKDLGYSDESLSAGMPEIFVPGRDDFRQMLPPRKQAGDKFAHGQALLVCGSRGMTGSATLVARAALRTGCGMAHLAAPASVVNILSSKLTETVIHAIPETLLGTPAAAALEEVLALGSHMQALALGPGISHESETAALVRELVTKCKLPVVLDADGINAYKGDQGKLKAHGGDLILTPHRGEWQRLFGALPANPAGIIACVKKTAADYGLTILLKGNPTLVATADGKAYIAPFGNSALAKAGCGDVLTGIIVSLLAQGALPVYAALLGAYLHGEAGSMASAKLSEYSVVASDVVNAVPPVIRKLCEVTAL